jgi:hypothetical protein
MRSVDERRRRGRRHRLQPLVSADSPRIGPYTLLGRLGSGGMGRVAAKYHAEDRSMRIPDNAQLSTDS